MAWRRCVGSMAFACMWAASQTVPPGTSNGEWSSYAGDLRNFHYSPLDQINANNFNRLEVAWRFKTDNLGNRPEYKLEATPLMIRGVLYATAGSRRSAIALDAATGDLLWVHGESEGARGAAAPHQLSGRGLSYWADGNEERILYVTPGYRLVCLDAKTGVPIRSFGDNGSVDMKKFAVYGTGQPIDLVNGEIGLHATPAVTRSGVVLVGSAFREGGTPKTHNNTKGMVLAFDARTGKKLWQFNTIPRPGEFGNDTWLKESWAVNGNVGVWSQMAVDEELGLAYLPVETPSSDFYGGHRPGNNLFADSLVCVDLKTGERKWHYQLVHHSIWNMDIAAAPVLADLTVNGKPDRRQPDRLHPAASRRSLAPGLEVQAGADLHADSGEPSRRANRLLPVVGRDELAGLLIRSRDSHCLCSFVRLVSAGGVASAAKQRVLRYRLCRRVCHHRRAVCLRTGRERRRRCAAAGRTPRGIRACWKFDDGWRRQ